MQALSSHRVALPVAALCRVCAQHTRTDCAPNRAVIVRQTSFRRDILAGTIAIAAAACIPQADAGPDVRLLSAFQEALQTKDLEVNA